MPAYLKLNKGIKGPVTTKGFEDHIEVNLQSMGLERTIGTAARGNKNREHSEPEFHPVVLTKDCCIASPKLFLASVGPLDHEAEIKFTTTANGNVETYLTVKLENVGIGKYFVSTKADGTPVETLELHYDKISITHTGHGPDVTGTPETVGYDLKAMNKT
jgi:type VI secretion system Hcp family effector